MSNEKNKSKKVILMILLILIIVISGTAAWLTWRSKDSALVLTVGEIDGSTISLYPYQLDGTLSPVLSYTSSEYVQVDATNKKSAEQNAKLFYNVKSIDSALISNAVKYTVTSSNSKNGTYTEYASGDLSSASSGGTLDIADISIPANSSKYFRVYLWLDGNNSNSTSMQNKSLSLELRAEFVNQSGPAVPELDDGMIPVVFDSSGTDTVTKTIDKDDPTWYNYENKEWANVVLTTTSSRSKYLGTSGVSISDSDILAYYVWIPRYKYKIWTTTTSSNSKKQTIEIVFEDKKATKSVGTTVDSFRTHPAFTFGNTELNGIWVGKFETTGNATTPTIKPNLVSLRNQNVSTQFTTAQKFGTSTYGSTSKVDAHMMKNSEWGAVAYLSHSIYGINEEIYINNSSGYYTGRSGGNVGGSVEVAAERFGVSNSNQYIIGGYYTWDGKTLDGDGKIENFLPVDSRTLGTKASTTGNITGIYDMSGGTQEYVMGNYNDMTSSDGFSTMPDGKYYDKYISSSIINGCSSGICYGHALFETAGWYNDSQYFIEESFPWILRGRDYSGKTLSGIFAFDFDIGSASNYGFRSVIANIG